MARFANRYRQVLHRYTLALIFSVVLGSATTIHAQMERPVDKQLFCGAGREGHQAAIDYIKTRSENDSSIDRLTPEFACGLAEFLKAAPPAITVGVGWYEVTASVATRGVAYCQHYQCKEGTNSHPRGLAADLLYGGAKKGQGGPGASAWCHRNALCTWAHQNASSFGLMFRLMPESGCPAGYFEPWHIEIKGVGGCQGSDTFGGGTTASAAPLGLGNALRDLLGRQQQPAIPSQSAQPSSAIAQSQSPLASFETVSGSYAPTIEEGGSAVDPVSSYITASGANTAHATSAADRLAELAFGEHKTSPTATTSVPIIISGANAAALAANQNPTAQQQVQSSGISAASQQTFVSGDLSWQNDTTFSQGPVSGWEAILITLKATLQRILAYLEPFGVRERPEAD